MSGVMFVLLCGIVPIIMFVVAVKIVAKREGLQVGVLDAIKIFWREGRMSRDPLADLDRPESHPLWKDGPSRDGEVLEGATVVCNYCNTIQGPPRKTKRFGEIAFEWICPSCERHLVEYPHMVAMEQRQAKSKSSPPRSADPDKL